MQDFTRVKRKLDGDDVQMHLTCPCRHTAEFESFEAYLNAGGAVVVEVPLIIKCPRCQRDHVADVSISDSDDGRALVVELDPGAETREESAFTIGSCPSCGGDVRNIDYNEGPGAPEAGWKYYECPECGNASRPDRFGEDA